MAFAILVCLIALFLLAQSLVLWDARQPEKKFIKKCHKNLTGWIGDYRELKKNYGDDHPMTEDMKNKIVREWKMFEYWLMFHWDPDYAAKTVSELRMILYKEGITVNTRLIVWT